MKKNIHKADDSADFVCDKPSEECAVFGVSFAKKESSQTVPNAALTVYYGLLSLQHRGQESSGIATLNKGHIELTKGLGHVTETFSYKSFEKLKKSCVSIGHTRYSSEGVYTAKDAGPFAADYLTGRVAVSHNGSITNSANLKGQLAKMGVNFDSTCDSEVIARLIGYKITKLKSTVDGVIRAASLLKGAFSLVIATGKGRLIAVRDPNGYRPLCIGKNENGLAVASESCALDICGFEWLKDVAPGEVVVIENGKIARTEYLKNSDKKNGLCIFEFIYFARPDSTIDGQGVYAARYNAGKILATEHPAPTADIVCAVPDSGLAAAAGFADASGIPISTGFIKNRYVGRSFIYPTQELREIAVRVKLNPVSANIKGKSIVLIDDSIVRGTTIKKTVAVLKKAGAREIHLRISSPPFKHICRYGTDIHNEDKLIANKMDLDGIAKFVGADSLGYISLDGLKKACSDCNLPFCTACFK